jgi:hypothetical protein
MITKIILYKTKHTKNNSKLIKYKGQNIKTKKNLKFITTII